MNSLFQKAFADIVVAEVQNDDQVLGVAAAGSWLTDELDVYSDLDLILVTREKLGGDSAAMLQVAQRFGILLSSFTGDHVGEPRLLICLYDNPLLHVDIKFLTLEEFGHRIEVPDILLDKNGELQTILERTTHSFPFPKYQWMEDRFWTWIHYILLKIGRGEYMEAYDCFSLLRGMILGPLLHIKNGKLPRGVRKVEMLLPVGDQKKLQLTLPLYERESLLAALQNIVSLYRELRIELFTNNEVLHLQAESSVMNYFEKIKLSSV